MNAPPPSVAVFLDESDSARRERAESLARQLDLPIVTAASSSHELLLAVTPTRLELRSSGTNAPGAVYAEFVGGTVGYDLRTHGSRLLYQAIGLHLGVRSVFDATAGLGEDAFLLAAKGCQVIAVERSPLVAALLQDGLRRASEVSETREAAGRIELRVGDARGVLRELDAENAPEVVYLDPMFPPKRKSALVRKEMRVLRRVVGDDPDARELFDAARSAARRHVVVKRMRHAPQLAPGPTRRYEGRSTRYDVYACG